MNNTKTLSTLHVGEVFKIGDLEFFKVAEENGVVSAVCKDILYRSQFGKSNDFSKSEILEKLTSEILPKIEAVVGAENVLEFETALLSLDGSAKHGTLKSKISIPTFDFYRNNRAVFEKHKVDAWWWLATPDSTSEYYNDNWCVCVAPSGYIDNDCIYNNNGGVRPILSFVSSISVSCDK